MSRSSVNDRLIRSAFCYGTEVAPVQCGRCQSITYFGFRRSDFGF